MVDFYSVLSPMMTTQKKILPAGVTFNPSSFLSQSPDFLKPGLFFGLFGTIKIGVVYHLPSSQKLYSIASAYKWQEIKF